MSEPEILGRVLEVCPLCGYKFMDEPGGVIITPQYYILGPDPNKPLISQPKICCLQCGIEFFPPNILEMIKENAKKQVSSIIVPPAGFKLN